MSSRQTKITVLCLAFALCVQGPASSFGSVAGKGDPASQGKCDSTATIANTCGSGGCGPSTGSAEDAPGCCCSSKPAAEQPKSSCCSVRNEVSLVDDELLTPHATLISAEQIETPSCSCPCKYSHSPIVPQRPAPRSGQFRQTPIEFARTAPRPDVHSLSAGLHANLDESCRRAPSLNQQALLCCWRH